MYDAISDPYCYPGTAILKNVRGLRDQAALDMYEAAMSAQRADEPLPHGLFSPTHYCAIHKHLFGDVYRWAGRYRRVRLSKGGNMFCYPEHIRGEMTKLFKGARTRSHYGALPAPRFAAELSHFLAELNAIHPFREGNGRTQLTFAVMMASRAGHPLNLDKLDPNRFLNAMIASFKGTERALKAEVLSLL